MTSTAPDQPPEHKRGIGLSRNYERLPEVEAEIQRLPLVTDPGFRVAVEQAQAVETVVYAIRQLLRAHRMEEARAVGNLLAVRAESMMAKAARFRFPRSAEQREELAALLAERMVCKVYDTSPTAEFWEVHFEDALIKASRDLWRSMMRERTEEPPLSIDAPRSDGTRIGDSLAAPGTLDEDVLAALERDDAMREAFARLNGNTLLAVRLAMEGLPDRSNDPSVLTISRVMDRSDRMLRNYWKEAKDALGPWLRERGYAALGDTPA